MALLRRLASEDGRIVHQAFFCPGCGIEHEYRVLGPAPRWQWDGSLDRPTFTPALCLFSMETGELAVKCHLSISVGMIEYHDDCTHDFRGLVIQMRKLRAANEETRVK